MLRNAVAMDCLIVQREHLTASVLLQHQSTFSAPLHHVIRCALCCSIALDLPFPKYFLCLVVSITVMLPV